MISSNVRRPWQAKLPFAAVMMTCFCLIGLVPVVHGQSDLVSQRISQLKDRNPNVRSNAAATFEHIKDPRAVAPLVAALRDVDGRVRSNAAAALGKNADPRAVEPLIAALRDVDGRVRSSAAVALGKNADPRAVEPLIAALRDVHPWLRKAAAAALGEIKDPRAVEPLIAALKDADRGVPGVPGVRSSAAVALGEIRDPRAVEPLIAALKSDDDAFGTDLRGRLIGALGAIGAPSVDPLIAALNDENPSVRGNSVRALWEIEDPSAFRALREPAATALIARDFLYFIERGKGGTEDVLIRALRAQVRLDEEGKKMALAFLSCGNSVLEAAARDWAQIYRYMILGVGGSAGVRWGDHPYPRGQ